MKYIVSALLLTISLGLLSAEAKDQYVHGYYKADGSYVKGYHRSKANHTKRDNYSTQGNYNPYTGKKGIQSSSRHRKAY